jgi:DNA-binding transcriptional ArsR family regulator
VTCAYGQLTAIGNNDRSCLPVCSSGSSSGAVVRADNLAAHEVGEACVCALTEPLGLTQPGISHDPKILVAAGIFTRGKRGVWGLRRRRPSAVGAL